MQYKNYNIEDFLFDEFFVKWVKNPGPETEHFWNTWIENNPDQLHIINQAREIVNSIEPKRQYTPSIQDYEEVLENVLKQPTSWSQIGNYKRNDTLTATVKYAALFIILICLGGLISYFNWNNDDSLNQNQIVEKINPNGQKSTFELSDGTIVKLNAGSKLIFPATFDKEIRKVRLEGEAFFDVSRDESRPFIVQSEDLTAIVLGTSFDVKSYRDEDEKFVAVVSGIVKVVKSDEMDLPGSEFKLLNKNQMATFNSSTDIFLKMDSIPENKLAWRDNVLQFDHDDFEQVQHKLSRWYGVEFDNQSNNRFEGGFKGQYTKENLENVLSGLKDQYEFQYIIDGKKVIIY